MTEGLSYFTYVGNVALTRDFLDKMCRFALNDLVLGGVDLGGARHNLSLNGQREITAHAWILIRQSYLNSHFSVT